MSYMEMNEVRKEDVWFLDLEYNNHMCGDKALFCDLNERFDHFYQCKDARHIILRMV